MGQHSYLLFLIHHPLILALVPSKDKTFPSATVSRLHCEAAIHYSAQNSSQACTT
jgi:hypothetical protein